MIKKLFIWWHRRKAVYHRSLAAYHRANGKYDEMNFNFTYAEWHLEQIERLKKTTS